MNELITERMTFEHPVTGRKVRSRRHWRYEFPDTGEVVFVRKVNSTLLIDAMNELEESKPQPRIEELEIAGVMQREEQVHDPEYLEAMRQWDLEVKQLFGRMAVLRSVIGIENDHWKTDVEDYRHEMGSIGVDIQEPNDLILWVYRIASGSNDGIEEFNKFISTRSQPTEDAIAGHVATFRPGSVEQGAHLATNSTEPSPLIAGRI